MRTLMSRLSMALVALALVASACGDDGGDATEYPTTTPTDAGDDGESDTTSTTAAPDDTAEVNDTTTTTEPLELTDSFRGVTSEAITVGVVAVDLEALQGLVDLDHGSYEAAYRAVIDDVNANGGILGRRIDMVFEPFLPIGTVSMDEICARLVDDVQVFAVIGGLLDDGPLCYTEINDTAFVGSTQNDRRLERSSAPWFTGFRNADESVRVILNGFADQGFFEGAAVAVVAEVSLADQVESVALPLLDELGVRVVDVDYIEASLVDETATENEVGLMAERQQIEGADTVLTIAGAGPAMPAASRTSPTGPASSPRRSARSAATSATGAAETSTSSAVRPRATPPSNSAGGTTK